MRAMRFLLVRSSFLALRLGAATVAGALALAACGSDEGGSSPSGVGPVGAGGSGGTVFGGGGTSTGAHAGTGSGAKSGAAGTGVGGGSGGTTTGGGSGGAGSCVDPATLPKHPPPTLDGGSSCSPISTCSGAVADGKWVLSTLCVPDAVMWKDADTKVQGVCPTAFGSSASENVQGTLAIALGTMTLHVHASGSKIYTLPNNCSFCQCSQLESELLSAGVDASCSPQCNNGDCTCFVNGSFDEDVTSAYTASGGKIQTTDGKTFDACATTSLFSLSEGTSSSNRHSATFVPAGPEVCNGADDDANGMVDDHPIDCPTCKKAGVCAQGVKATCSGGWQCTYTSPDFEPTEQTCDGLDNDCNGVVDDGPSVDASCQAKNGLGSTCKNGVCTCSGTSCGGKCVDTQSDSQNCGSCGHACSGGTPFCVAGACVCESPLVQCGDQCVNVQGDPNNCGSCGTKCAVVCTDGQCGCFSGQTLCGTICVDTTSDPNHCGSCGGVCPSGQSCNGGTCGCPSGEQACNGTCTSVLSDSKNCGFCGNDCGAGVGCSNGSCGCFGGETYCGGACVVTSTDANNCGGCGIVCTNGKICSNGTCQCDAFSGMTDCNGTCVSTSSDPMHCGACTTVCAPGQTCSFGQCQCQNGETICDPTVGCVNTATDNANCGTCGTVCGTGKSCQSGTCQCMPGLTMCSTSCVNLMTDKANCGTCAHTCPGTKTCQNGACI